MKERKSTKIMARLLAFALIVVMLMSGVAAYAGQTRYLNNAPDMFNYVSEGYSDHGNAGPISIADAHIVKGRKTTDVVLVTFSGTDLVFNQATEVLTDLFSGFNLNNSYYLRAVQTIRANVDKGSTLVLAGHSLGGMVAQQVAANPLIKKEYKVLNTVTFGSPLLSQGFREGSIKRLGDWIDPVPYLSINTITAPIRSILGLNREKGPYKNPIDAHKWSYRKSVWNKYDPLGYTIGKCTIRVDENTRVFYPAPIFDLSIFNR